MGSGRRAGEQQTPEGSDRKKSKDKGEDDLDAEISGSQVSEARPGHPALLS